MSSFYLDVLKDRLYTFRTDSVERRAAQWVLSRILSMMTKLMAPILSFTAEEVWQNIRTGNQSTGQGNSEIEESVFLASFPAADATYSDRQLEEKWNHLFVLRNEVNKALEMKRSERFLGNSLEAKVNLYLPGSYKDLLTGDRDFLPTFFIVSAVELSDESMKDSYRSTEIDGLEITIERAGGLKCQRCWNWSTTVGRFTDKPDICERCYNVVVHNE
jgi:isoleucyl-tRNA synthetase